MSLAAGREHVDPLDVAAALDASTSSDLFSSSALASYCVLTQRKHLPPQLRHELRELSLNDLPAFPENSVDVCLQRVSNSPSQALLPQQQQQRQPQRAAAATAFGAAMPMPSVEIESDELGPGFALGVLRCVCDSLLSASPASGNAAPWNPRAAGARGPASRPFLESSAWPVAGASLSLPPLLADSVLATNQSGANESLQQRLEWPLLASFAQPAAAPEEGPLSSLPPLVFLAVLLLLVLLPLVTVLGNLLVVVSVLTDRALRHSLTNNYILSLAVADVAGALIAIRSLAHLCTR